MKKLSKREKWISTEVSGQPLSQIDRVLWSYIKGRAEALFSIRRMPTIRLEFFKWSHYGKYAPVRTSSIASHDEDDMCVIVYDDVVAEVIPEAVRDNLVNLAEIAAYVVHEAMHLLQKRLGTFEWSDDYYESSVEREAYRETVRRVKYELGDRYEEPELREKVIQVLQRKIPRASKEYWEGLYDEIV